MYQKILLAVDATPRLEPLLETTTRLALAGGAGVLVFHAATGEGAAAAEAARDELLARGVSAESRTLPAGRKEVARAVAAAAADGGADLIVMGSRGLSELRAVLAGSVSHELITRSELPVLLVKSGSLDGPSPDGKGPVLAAVETPGDLETVLGAVAAAGAGARVVLLHVREVVAAPGYAYVEPEAEAEALLREARARLDASGLRATARVGECTPGQVGHFIAEEARACGASLIVVGSRRPGHAEGALVGSTARQVLHHSPCPVLIAAHVAEPGRVAGARS